MADLTNEFISHFEKIEKEFDELEELLNSVEIVSDNRLFLYYKKRFDYIEKIAKMYKNYKNIIDEINENNGLLKIENDIEFQSILKIEIKNLEQKREIEFQNLKMELKNFKQVNIQDVQIEIVFKQGDKEKFQLLKNIFFAYSERYKSELKLLKESETSFSFNINGENVYDDLILFLGNSKIIENGKDTLVGVSVLKNQKTDFEIDENDIVVETLKSSGAGGQHINKTESAVRLVHKPTGIVAFCGDERSQRQNKDKAMESLKNKIFEDLSKKQAKNIEFQRKTNKNALFSSTPTTIFDFDRNNFYSLKTNQNYILKEILSGELKIISRDVIDYE